MNSRILTWLVIAIAVLVVLLLPHIVRAHDIYTGVTGHDGQNCCSGDDCEEAEYREARGVVEFYSTRHSAWVKVDHRDITHENVKGSRPGVGHWCGMPRDKTGTKRGIDPLFSTYCAFMPAGDS